MNHTDLMMSGTQRSWFPRKACISAAAIGIIAASASAQSRDIQDAINALNGAAGTTNPVSQPSGTAAASGSKSDIFGPGSSSDAAPLNDGENIAVSEFLTVDIFVKDEDLTNVLRLLAEQSRKNIVASRDVSASVTANFYGVTFYEALDAILHVNGYGYEEKGNFIYVYTIEELEAIRASQRTVAHRIVRLDYLKADDAAKFVQPALSPDGTITASGAVSDFTLSDGTPIGGEDFANETTLVITDYEENIEEIVALLEELDTRPAQVLVEATILQTALTEANAFGVDFAILDSVNFLDFFEFGGPLGSALGLTGRGENQVAPIDNKATAVNTGVGNIGGPASFRASVISNDVAFFIRALDEVSDVSIVSNPKILTLNRQPARVLVGRKVGYLQSTSTDTATSQTVEFLDTGTQLAFRPFIMPKDGTIRLELAPRVSEGVIRNSTDLGGNTITIPDEINQELITNVIVPDGATVVLGGLFRESTTLSRSQVPFLGDLPIVGGAFRGHDDVTDRSEIMFLITPTVVNDQILLDQGERSTAYADQVRVGSRQGLLPFSRERQTAQLNIEAQRHAQEGNFEKAAWCLRRSLELNPMQPEARRLQEVLFNETSEAGTRSLMEHIIDGEIEERFGKLGEAYLKAEEEKTLAALAAKEAKLAQRSAKSNSKPATTSNSDLTSGFDLPEDSTLSMGSNPQGPQASNTYGPEAYTDSDLYIEGDESAPLTEVELGLYDELQSLDAMADRTSSIRSDISTIDSSMWTGTLPPQAFDAFDAIANAGVEGHQSQGDASLLATDPDLALSFRGNTATSTFSFGSPILSVINAAISTEWSSRWNGFLAYVDEATAPNSGNNDTAITDAFDSADDSN